MGQHIQWIHPDPALHHLKTQVETCAAAGIAYIPYNLPCRYRFPCGNGSLRHVDVPRGQAAPLPSKTWLPQLLFQPEIMTVPLWAARIDVPSGVGIYSRSSSSHIRYIRYWVLPFFVCLYFPNAAILGLPF